MGLRSLLAVAIASVALAGCGGTAPGRPLASGTLRRVTVWSRPVQRPGELGENSGESPPAGSRVEVFDQFILITPPGGSTILSPHGWYTGLAFDRDRR